MNNREAQKILSVMGEAALAAGQIIMEIYNQKFTSTQKDDGTPVTRADACAEEIVLAILAPLNIPVLAEESASAGQIPELGERFFVVDPLDGTREFIKRNDEFTVNIALINKGRPIMGIVTAPALNIGFIGSASGAFSFSLSPGALEKKTAIQVCSKGPLSLLISRSHAHPYLKELQEKLEFPQCQPMGSSLKICSLAMGKASLYPRFGITSEWDIAAGQAVLEAAGGTIVCCNGGEMRYGKISQRFAHPPFAAAQSRELALQTIELMNEIEQSKPML